MVLDPLSLLILLFFLAAVALALTLWFLLSLFQARLEPEPARQANPQPPASVTPTDLKNDDFRGAKVKRAAVKPAAKRDDDAFERFIKSKNDELEF